MRPARPGFGTVGKVTIARTNFFPFKVTKDVYYEYLITIKPDPPSQKARVKRRILKLFEESAVAVPYRNFVVHDGSQRLIAARKLPESFSATVRYYEEGDSGPPPKADEYTVTVEYAYELSTLPLKECVHFPHVLSVWHL